MLRDCRREASLLLSEGHAAAWRYPLGKLWSEARFVRERWVGRTSTEAVVMQAAIVSALAGGKHLKDVLEDLRDGV